MNTVLMYGRTGTTKTTQLRNIAIRLRELYRGLGVENPMFRYVGADSGWGPMDDIVLSNQNPNGFVEALDVSAFPGNPFGVLNAIADGRWIEFVEMPDPKIPKQKIIRPAWSMNTQLPNNICGYLVEGLNTLSDVLLQDHITTNRKIGQDLSAKSTVYADVMNANNQLVQLGYTIGAAGQSHYGQVQRFMLTDLLPKLKSLRREDGSSLPWLIVTAHEAEGADDFSKSVLGPATIGRAMVGSTPQKFQDCIHLYKVIDPKTGKREIRAYFWDHPEPGMPVAGGFMLWPAKVSFPPHVAKGLDSRWPGAYIPITWETGVEQLIEFRFEKGA